MLPILVEDRVNQAGVVTMKRRHRAKFTIFIIYLVIVSVFLRASVSGQSNTSIEELEVLTADNINRLTSIATIEVPSGQEFGALSPIDLIFAVVNEQQHITLWTFSLNGIIEQIATLEGPIDRFHQIEFSPNGQIIAYWSSGPTEVSTHIWKINPPQELLELTGTEAGRFAFSEDSNQFAVVDSLGDGSVLIVDIQTLEHSRVPPLPRPRGMIWSSTYDVAFSPTNASVVIGNEMGIGMWNPAGEETEFYNLGTWITGVEVSPDGSLLWLAFDGEPYVCPLEALMDHNYEDCYLAVRATFNQGGDMIFSISDDNHVIFLDSQSGEELETLPGIRIEASTLHLGAEGKLLLTQQEDGVIDLWGVYRINQD
jgi:WD40 repeat protein